MRMAYFTQSYYCLFIKAFGCATLKFLSACPGFVHLYILNIGLSLFVAGLTSSSERISPPLAAKDTCPRPSLPVLYSAWHAENAQEMSVNLNY